MTILLNKKRLVVLLGMIMISIFSYIIVSKDNILINNKVVETVSTPVTNKVIVVDARTWLTR